MMHMFYTILGKKFVMHNNNLFLRTDKLWWIEQIDSLLMTETNYKAKLHGIGFAPSICESSKDAYNLIDRLEIDKSFL